MRCCYRHILRMWITILCVTTLSGCAGFQDFLNRAVQPANKDDQARSSVKDENSTPESSDTTQEEAPVEIRYLPAPKSDVHEILAYFQYLQELPANELALEYRQARRSFEKKPENYDRFRLICMSLLPNQRFTDRAYALKLLNDFEKTSPRAKADLTRFAGLLKLLLVQQQDLHKELLAEKEKADVLARQLKELKDIEKILSERELKGLNGK